MYQFPDVFVVSLITRPKKEPVRPVMGIAHVYSIGGSWFTKDSLGAIKDREAEAGTAWLTNPTVLEKIRQAVVGKMPREVRKAVLAIGR